MILDKLQETNTVIQTALNYKDNAASIKEYESQLTNLKNVSTLLNNRLELVEELVKRKIAEPFIPESTQKTIQEAICQCGEKTEELKLDAAAVAALKSASELVKTLTDTAWKNAADQRYSKAIDMLQISVFLLPSPKESKELAEALNDARTQPPASISGIDKIEEKLRRAEKLIDQLNVSDDPEIVSFLEKVKERQATINDLSPKILDWLKNNHLSGRFKLSFAAYA